MSNEPYCVWCNRIGHEPTAECQRRSAARTKPDRQDGDGLPLEVRIQTTRYALFRLFRANAPYSRLREEWSKLETLLDTEPSRDAAEGAVPIGEDTPYWRALRAALSLSVEDQYKVATDLAANCGYELTGDAYTATPKPAPDAMPIDCAECMLLQARPRDGEHTEEWINIYAAQLSGMARHCDVRAIPLFAPAPDAMRNGLPKPETMLTYASILEKPQYWVDPKTGHKFLLPTGEIIEAACAALRHCASAPAEDKSK